MCIKDPITKTCWKNGKDLSNGASKIIFEIIPKKRIFPFLPKISAGHGWSRKIFFANFQILGPLGCQGWVVIPQNVKKITAPYCTMYMYKDTKLCCIPFLGKGSVSWGILLRVWYNKLWFWPKRLHISKKACSKLTNKKPQTSRVRRDYLLIWKTREIFSRHSLLTESDNSVPLASLVT